jgi:hypothetical protein
MYKSILHLSPGMKQINVNCSPTVSVYFTKEGQHFLSIKVHTIILHILLIDFHFIKSTSPTLFLHYDHLNFMLETRQRSVARAYSRGLNFDCRPVSAVGVGINVNNTNNRFKPQVQPLIVNSSKYYPVN